MQLQVSLDENRFPYLRPPTTIVYHTNSLKLEKPHMESDDKWDDGSYKDIYAHNKPLTTSIEPETWKKLPAVEAALADILSEITLF